MRVAEPDPAPDHAPSMSIVSRPEHRVVDGHRMINRAAITAATGMAEQTLANLYAGRAGNGHPEGTRIGRGLFFDEDIWRAWYARWTAAKRASLSPVDRGGDPDELVDSAGAGAILGYGNASTIRGYIARDEAAAAKSEPGFAPYFPPPDEVDELPSGRLRRWWMRRTIWEFADRRSRPGRGGVARHTRS